MVYSLWQAGITQFERAPSLNGEPLLTKAQTELVLEHLASGQAVASPQYAINCAGCINPACRTMLNPVAPYCKLRDAVSPALIAASAPGAATVMPVWPSAAESAQIKALGSTPNK